MQDLIMERNHNGIGRMYSIPKKDSYKKPKDTFSIHLIVDLAMYTKVEKIR